MKRMQINIFLLKTDFFKNYSSTFIHSLQLFWIWDIFLLSTGGDLYAFIVAFLFITNLLLQINVSFITRVFFFS